MGPVLDHDFYGQIYISLGEGIIHTLGNCLVTPLDLRKKWTWVKDLRQVDPIHIW